MNGAVLKEGTSVFSSDGKELGKINRIVLNPDTNEITHIVVQKGWLFAEDKVIPYNRVRSATGDKVVIDKSVDDFDQLPPFEETHYVGVSARDAAARTMPAEAYPGDVFVPGFYWYPPYGYAGSQASGLPYYTWPRTETEQNIPANTVPLQEGAKVISADDKHIGNVDRLLVGPNSSHVTHFVIAEGLFFKDKKLVPANWIKTVSNDEVRLNVSADILNRVPSYHYEP
ncbi:MAG: PRC-barrel domain-containing protein [Bacteroidota bacterium]